MFIKVEGIDEAEVNRVVAFLQEAGWFGGRKEPVPHMNYKSIEVFMPPRKAPA